MKRRGIEEERRENAGIIVQMLDLKKATKISK
jgi:hypothetical protein